METGGGDLRCLLAAVPHLLHLHVPRQKHRAQVVHPARLPGLLLVGHGKLIF